MPPGVVVVQRARRRPFALLWAGPTWLRSIWSSWRSAGDEGPRPFAMAASVPAERPHLRFGEPIERAPGESAEASASACNACEACIPICPSQSLHLNGEGGRPTRFELDLGSCIGCGRCIEICPESALVARPAPPLLLPTPAGRLPRIDLLAENEPGPDRLQ